VTFEPTPPPTGDTEASQFTKPLRELIAFVLLGGNAILLFLSITSLIFVLDGWASEFGRRAASTYYGFVGEVSIVAPLIAVLIATHIRPAVRRARVITIVAVAEYAVSAFFGIVTFIGAFAEDVANGRGSTVRFVFENLLTRMVWFAFFAVAAYVVWRVAMGLYLPRLVGPGAPGHTQPGYAQPGHSPVYGQPGAAPSAAPESNGWPQVPPPPMPNPPSSGQQGS
jgi:hypothetical protein